MIQLQLPLEIKFKHECPDWDFLDIDETWPEFEACCCEFGIEADEIRVRHANKSAELRTRGFWRDGYWTLKPPYADQGPIDFLEAL